MKSELVFRLIDSEDANALDQIEQLLPAMYLYMSQCGLTLPLADGGAAKWRLAAQRTIGRLGTIAVACDGEQVVGFVRGVIRLGPDHLGSTKIGFVDHTFVAEKYRGQGVGRKLFTLLENWFRDSAVKRLELQVLCQNKSAIAAWSAFGFAPELLQMQKTIE